MVAHCQDLTREMRLSDAELEQVLALGEDMRGQLEVMKGSLMDKEQECDKLTRTRDAFKEELEESNATLSKVQSALCLKRISFKCAQLSQKSTNFNLFQVESELVRCRRQLSECKDNADTWEQKESEGVKRVKQLNLEMDDLRERLDKTEDENIELKDKLKCCQDKKEHVSEELETLHDKMEELESALSRTERKKTGLEEREAELTENVNKHVLDIEKLKQELAEQKFEAENTLRRSQDEIMRAQQSSNDVEILRTKCAG